MASCTCFSLPTLSLRHSRGYGSVFGQLFRETEKDMYIIPRPYNLFLLRTFNEDGSVKKHIPPYLNVLLETALLDSSELLLKLENENHAFCKQLSVKITEIVEEEEKISLKKRADWNFETCTAALDYLKSKMDKNGRAWNVKKWESAPEDELGFHFAVLLPDLAAHSDMRGRSYLPHYTRKIIDTILATK